MTRRHSYDRQALFQGIVKFVLGVLLLGALLFLPAGTFAYPQAWVLLGVLFVPMFLAGVVLMFKNPELLRKRLNAKEQENEQKLVLLLSGLMFLTAFVVAGLNYRFGWLVLPVWASRAATVVFLLAYALYAEVLRENTYLSRTVEVQENQYDNESRVALPPHTSPLDPIFPSSQKPPTLL